jgi:hypothetical protein
MRLAQAPNEMYSVAITAFVRRTGTSASRRRAAYLQASGLAAFAIGCLANHSAHADTNYGTGSYTVPDQLPYGVYVAHADPGANSSAPAACTFSTWTKDGKFISGDSASETNSVTARIAAPLVAKFITHGCTPWVKVG